MGQAFFGFSPETLDFMLGIRLHNEQTFYAEHKAQYERVLLEPMKALCEDLGPAAQALDDTLETRPGKCASRLRRDTRFSKDKRPFRDNAWLCFKRPGEDLSESFALFFEITLDGYMYGLGSYTDNKPLMDRVRARIARDPAAADALFTALIRRGYELSGESYKKMKPPELPEAARRVYLFKGFSAYRQFAGHQAVLDAGFVQEMRDMIADLTPLYHFVLDPL